MPYTAISLGWGVQSTTLAVMVAFGDLPPVDVAIHADTTHESKLTYEFAGRWTEWLEKRGVKAVTVRGNYLDPLNHRGCVSIPAYSVSTSGKGQLSRHCTYEWKIAPIRRWLQANRNGQPVEQWIGISLDEFQRMKPSGVRYITNRYPLIEKHMTRRDCEMYLQTHGIEIPPRSSCVFCPFKSFSDWRHTKVTLDDWLGAVELDRLIRNARRNFDTYLHPSRKPLEDIDLRSDVDRGQLSLWDDECTGLCGV